MYFCTEVKKWTGVIDGMEVGYGILGAVLFTALACVPASIAKKKGYSFGIWWVYGWFLFIVALFHSLALQARPSQY